MRGRHDHRPPAGDMCEHGAHHRLALGIGQHELFGELARMQNPCEPASIMKSIQRRWPSRSRLPRASKMVGATGKTPR